MGSPENTFEKEPKSTNKIKMLCPSLFYFLVSGIMGLGSCTILTVTPQDLSFLLRENATFTLFVTNFSGPPDHLSFDFLDGNPSLLLPLPNQTVEKDGSFNLSLVPTMAGHVDVVVRSQNNNTDCSNAFVRVSVTKSDVLSLVIVIIGWIYFLAWSISFYPQIIENFRRKSVIGLNFDFLSLNVVGFTLYGLYNIGLFWIDSVQEEYLSRHPRGVIPVLANDVFFPIHAVFACAFSIFQCIMYERGDQ